MRNEQNPVWLVPINLISHGTSVNKKQLLKNKWNPLLSGVCLINLIHTRLPLTLFIKVIKNYLRHCICHFKYTTLHSIFWPFHNHQLRLLKSIKWKQCIENITLNTVKHELIKSLMWFCPTYSITVNKNIFQKSTFMLKKAIHQVVLHKNESQTNRWRNWQTDWWNALDLFVRPICQSWGGFQENILSNSRVPSIDWNCR